MSNHLYAVFPGAEQQPVQMGGMDRDNIKAIRGLLAATFGGEAGVPAYRLVYAPDRTAAKEIGERRAMPRAPRGVETRPDYHMT